MLLNNFIKISNILMNTLFLLKQRVNYVKTENTIKYKFK